MNIRQRKKRFKKQFGFNPPKSLTIRTAIQIAERREEIIAAVERLKKAILDLWEIIKKPALEFVEAVKAAAKAFISEPERQRRYYVALVDFQSRLLLQQRQQEREVKTVESSFNIYRHDRR